MPRKQVVNWKKHMVQLFKDSLARPVPVELLDDWPEIQNAMAEGQPAPQTAEVLVAKIIRYAVERGKANTWAVEMIYEYVVGKPQLAPQDGDSGRHFDEKLEDVTTDHLNSLAATFASSNGGLVPSKAQDKADRPMAGAAVGVPEDGPRSTEGPSDEPEMA